MENTIRGNFYNDVILEVVKPKIIDVSEADYTAEIFKLNDQPKEKQHPFIVAHPVEITLRVVPFYNDTDELTWTFIPGERPIPLKKIVNHVDNSITTGIHC